MMTDPVPETSPPDVWNIHQSNSRRSLSLCAAGAVVGLFIAGFGLFTAQGTRTFVIPPEDAAMVNGVPILMTDYAGQIATLYNVSLTQATVAQKHKTLDDMIREEIYVQRGVELGLPTDDIDVRQALVAGTEAVVSQDALTEQPSDADLRAWYAAHSDTYSSEGEMTLQEYRVPPADAVRIVTALRSGASAASLNLVSTRRVDDGEEFYFAAKLHLGDQVFAIARAMHDGQVSYPVIQADGAHILVMQHNHMPLPAAYALASDRVLHDFLDAKVMRLQSGNARFLRKRADVKIAAELR